MKVCITCKIEKDVLSFYKDKTSKSGLRSSCKECASIYKKNNLILSRKSSKKYRENNKQKIKDYKLKIRENINLYNREKYKLSKSKRKYKKRERSIQEKFISSIRNSILNSIKRRSHKKNSKTNEILGCSFEFFKIYIESKFEPWMNWENRALYNGELNYGWDLDHIIPLSSAKTEEDIIRLNHHTNFQPLCSYTNRYIKRDKINYDI
jgi:hypothetical protein